MIDKLRQRPKWTRITAKLLQISYSCEANNLQAISGRPVLSNRLGRVEDFVELFRICSRPDNGFNPFHVIRVAFSRLSLGDRPTAPTKLFDHALRKEYSRLTEGWGDQLRSRVLHEWRAAKLNLEELADSLDCSLDQAALIANDSGAIPPLFTLAVMHTERREMPRGLKDESLRCFCLCPSAYIKAEADTGFKIPTSIRKYAKVANWAGEA